MKWFSFTCQAPSKTAEVLIYGVIDDWENNARDFAAQLNAIPADHEITIGINSRGGDVFAGYAIHGMLERRGVTTRCDGVCASMGSVIFQAGKKRIMPQNSMMLLHDPAAPYTPGRGTADDHRETADALDKITSGLVAIYMKRSGQTAEAIKTVMAEEKFLTAKEAKDLGLCDEISGAVEIKNSVDLGCFRNAPKEFGPKSQTEETPPNPQNHCMKSLLVALAAAGLIPSADASESDAVVAFSRNFATIKASADEATALREKNKNLREKAADDFVSQAVRDGKCGDDDNCKNGLRSMFLANEDGTRSYVAGLQVHAQKQPIRGAAPVPKQQGAKPGEEPTGETEDSLRAKLAEEKDPTKRWGICNQLREVRGHKDLFSAN